LSAKVITAGLSAKVITVVGSSAKVITALVMIVQRGQRQDAPPAVVDCDGGN
jgi:hypothetical protein